MKVSSHPAGGKAETVEEAAKNFEEVFVEQLFRNIYSTMNSGSLVKKSFQRRIYEQMLQKEFADLYARNGEMGLARVLKERLMQKMNPELNKGTHPLPEYREISRPENQKSIELENGEGWSGLDRDVEGMKRIYTEEREAGDVSEKR